jgi:hypothetical protein
MIKQINVINYDKKMILNGHIECARPQANATNIIPPRQQRCENANLASVVQLLFVLVFKHKRIDVNHDENMINVSCDLTHGFSRGAL